MRCTKIVQGFSTSLLGCSNFTLYGITPGFLSFNRFIPKVIQNLQWPTDRLVQGRRVGPRTQLPVWNSSCRHFWQQEKQTWPFRVYFCTHFSDPNFVNFETELCHYLACFALQTRRLVLEKFQISASHLVSLMLVTNLCPTLGVVLEGMFSKFSSRYLRHIEHYTCSLDTSHDCQLLPLTFVHTMLTLCLAIFQSCSRDLFRWFAGSYSWPTSYSARGSFFRYTRTRP